MKGSKSQKGASSVWLTVEAAQPRLEWSLPAGKLYLIAIATSLLAFILQVGLVNQGDHPPAFLLFILPILLCAYLGGLKYGLFATALACLGVNEVVLAAFRELLLNHSAQLMQWSLLAVLGVLLSVVLHHSQQQGRQAETDLAWQSSVFNILKEAVIQIDQAGCIVSLNTEAERLSGWAATEALGQTWQTVLPLLDPQTHEPLPNLVEALLHAPTQRPVPVSAWLRCRNGQELSVEGHGVPLQPADDALAGVVIVLRESAPPPTVKAASTSKSILYEQLIQLAASAPGAIGIYRLRPDGTVSFPFVSPAIEAIFGIRPEEVQEDATIIFQRIDPADVQSVHESTVVSARELQPWRSEFRVNHPTKGQIWVEGVSVPRADEEGDILWYGFLLDITARKQVEAAHKYDQARLAQVERFAHLGTWSVEYHDQGWGEPASLTWSDEVFRLFGYEPGEVTPTLDLFYDRVHPEDQKMVREVSSEALAKEQSYQLEHRILTARGEERILLEYAEIMRDEQDRPVRLLGTVHDVTELRRTAIAAHSNSERLNLALHAAKLGVWELNAQTNQLYWSLECHQIFGVTQFAGNLEAFTKLVHPADAVSSQAKFDAAMAARQLFENEFRIVRPDGEVRWVNNLAQGTYDHDGTLLRVVGTVQDVTSQKQAEASLRESQRTFQQLAESLPQFVWMTDEQGRNIYTSPQYLAYAGQSPEEQNVFNWLELVHPEDQPGLIKSMEWAKTQGTNHRYEFRVRRHDGVYRWFDSQAAPLCDEQGQIAKWIGLTADIQEQREVREALRASEERLRLATEAAEIGTWDRDMKSSRLIWSPTLERLMGLAPGSFPGTFGAFLALLHPQDYPILLAAQQRGRGANGLYHAELRFKLPDGEVRWGLIRGQVFLDQAGQPDRMVGIHMDITERKRSEVEVSHLAAIVESADEAIISHDFTGVITSWNKGAAQIFGYQATEIVGKNLAVLCPPSRQQERIEHLEKIKRGERVVHYETERVRKDGTLFPLAVTVSPIFNRNGEMIGLSKIGRDITVQKQTAAELQLWADAFVSCGQGITICDPKTERVKACNPAFARMRDCSVEEIVNAPLLAQYEPASHPLRRQLVAQSDSLGQAQGELYLRRGDGSSLPVQLDLVTVHDEAGQLRYRVATYQDITERQRAEAALRLSDERLRLVYRIISNYSVDYAERIRQLLELGTQQFGLENGVVGQVVDQQYSVTHAVSLDDSLAVGFACPLAQALCKEVLQRNDILAIHHASATSWREHLACATFGTEVYFGAPLQVGQRIYGTLCFASRTPRAAAFNSGDGEFLRLLAEWIGTELSRFESAEALRSAEERQRLALEAGQMGTWSWSPGQERGDMDERCRKLLGITPDPVTGELPPGLTWAHPDDVGPLQQMLWLAYEQQQPLRADFRVIHPDQSLHWLTVIGESTLLEGNEKRGLNGVLFEISEQKEAAERLRQSEQHFRALFDSSAVGNVECETLTGRFINVNQRMGKMLGYTPEELRERTFLDLTYHEDRAANWEGYQNFIWGKAPYYIIEKRFVHKDGSLIWVSVSCALLRDAQGLPWHTIAVVQDITERKRAIDELRESEQRFRQLFEQASVGNRIIDYETMRIVDCNEASARMLGYTREEFLGLTVADYEAKYPLAEVRHQRDLLRQRGQTQFETVLRSKTGELKNVLLSVSNIQIQGRDYLYSTALDITEQKHTAAALEQEMGRLSTIAEASPSVIFSFRGKLDGTFYYPYVSSAFMELYGLTPDEAKTQPYLTEEVVHPADRQGLHDSIIASARTMSRWHYTWRVNHPRKGEIWLEGYASPAAEGDGGIIWHGIMSEITERRRAEAELQRERERFEKIALSSPSVIYSFQLTKEGQPLFAYVSPSIEKIYGLSPEVLLKDATPVFAMIHPEDSPRVWQKIAESAQRMNIFHDTWRVRRPQNGEIWVEVYSAPVRDADGGITWHGIINDVTERRQAEQRIEENERLFRNVFNQQFQYMVILSPEGRVREINNLPLQVSGLSRADYLGQLIWQTPGWRDLAEWQEIWPARLAEAASTKVPVFTEDIYQLPTGEIGYADAATTAIRNAAGEVEYFIIQATDTTLRKRAERELTQQERWFRALTEHSTDSISVIDEHYQILYVSPAVASLEGYATNELIGRNAAWDTHPTDAAYLENVLRDLREYPGKSLPIVWRRRHKEGRWIWLEGVVTNLLDDPAVKGFVTNYRDITERRQAEQQLLSSQEELRQLATHLQTVREEERKTVAREIHDELGQQLTGARMNLKWLELNVTANPPTLQERLANTVELISQTIQTVRRISTSLHPAILDDFGLLAALEWQVNEFQKHTGVPCQFAPLVQELEVERPRALAVFRICQESLTNIAKHAHATQVLVSLGVDDTILWLRIEDNGRGILTENNVYKRSLGLISMRERMLSFGGEFTIDSVPGAGTTIEARLPLTLPV